MERYHRAQVLLEPEQYRQLRQLARARSAQEGRRVSVSELIREFLDQALAGEMQRQQQARAALRGLFTLGDALETRHPQPLDEDWLTADREEHDDARFQDLFPGG